MIDTLNAILWVTSNIMVGYIALALIVFVAAYPIFFDPGATTAGRLILRFGTSLVGVIGLVAISVFVDPREGSMWFEYPADIAPWRPVVRFVAYGYVSYAVTSLVVLLWLRKYRPRSVQTAPNETSIPRIRNTKENP